MINTNIKNLAVNGVITHSGVYHADDVVAAIILKATGVISSYAEIQRVAVVPEGFKGLTFDIGGGEFDHHQAEVKLHHDGSKYSACTLLAEQIFEYNSYQELYHCILKGIELTDNNGQIKYPNYYAKVVSSAFQLKKSFTEVCEGIESIIDLYIVKAETWDISDIPQIKNAFTEGILKEFQEFEKAENLKVAAFIEQHKGEKIALLEEHLPAFKMAGSSLILLIEKSLRGGYNVTVIANKMKIPAEVKNWDGCTFVHSAGFLAAFADLESAKKAAEKLLK